MESKYVGKQFGDWLVTDYFTKKNYKRKYGISKYNSKINAQTHKAMSYNLVNQVNNYKITLSGNTLRRMNNNETSIQEVLLSVSSKNKKLNSYKKKYSK